MKIGEAGEAFFVFETDEDVPDELMTSPLLKATEPTQEPEANPRTGRFGAVESKEEDVIEPPGATLIDGTVSRSVEIEKIYHSEHAFIQ